MTDRQSPRLAEWTTADSGEEASVGAFMCTLLDAAVAASERRAKRIAANDPAAPSPECPRSRQQS